MRVKAVVALAAVAIGFMAWEYEEVVLLALAAVPVAAVVFVAYAMFFLPTPEPDPEADPQLPAIDEDLLWLVMLPLEAWGFRSLEELNSRDRTVYFQSMFAALSIAARSGIGRNRLSEYPDSVLPRLRRLRDGKDAGPSGEERSHFEDREHLMDE